MAKCKGKKAESEPMKKNWSSQGKKSKKGGKK